VRIGRNTLAYGLMTAGVVITAAGGPITGATTASANTSANAPASVNVPAAASESGTLNCSQLESLWEKAGGSPSAAFMAAEIAMAESSGQQYSTDNDSDGSTDRGYWQINSTNPGSSYDPMTNAREAVSLSGDGANWGPWVTYQTGAYAGKC
jgi:hypothetical protein